MLGRQIDRPHDERSRLVEIEVRWNRHALVVDRIHAFVQGLVDERDLDVSPPSIRKSVFKDVRHLSVHDETNWTFVLIFATDKLYETLLWIGHRWVLD